MGAIFSLPWNGCHQPWLVTKKQKIGGKNLDVELRVQRTTREVSGRQFRGFLIMANADQLRSLETALLLEKGGSALRGKWRRKNQGN